MSFRSAHLARLARQLELQKRLVERPWGLEEINAPRAFTQAQIEAWLDSLDIWESDDSHLINAQRLNPNQSRDLGARIWRWAEALSQEGRFETPQKAFDFAQTLCLSLLTGLVATRPVEKSPPIGTTF